MGRKPGERPYIAVIGDLVASRMLDRRDEAQEKVVAVLQQANEVWESELEAGFVVTIGDEFQGLLRRPDRAFDVIASLEQGLGGIRTRYGIGLGTVRTELLPTALGMDGTAFHCARDAVERGKREDRWITVAGFGDDRDYLLNGVLRLMGGIRWAWTRVQAETVFAVRTTPTQKLVAKARQVSEATVSKALKAALYEQFAEGEELVATLLSTPADRVSLSPRLVDKE